MGSENMNYLCLSKNNFTKFVRELLLVRQHLVEVYEKVNASRVDNWMLEYKGSPGNLQQFEDVLFENNKNAVANCIMALNLKGSNIGLSTINITEEEISVTEFCDNEFFTELESIIACTTPKECVIPSVSQKELKIIQKLLKRNSILVVTERKEEYDESKVDQDLNRLLYFAENQPRNVQLLAHRNLRLAMSSTRALIHHLNLTANPRNFNQFRLKTFDQTNYVKMTTSGFYNLNILPVPGKKHNEYDTVFGVLNNCSTAQGTRLLYRWLKQPIKDINILTDRLNAVEALIHDSEARADLSSHRLRFPDLLFLSKKLASKKATLQDCYKVYSALESIPSLIHTLKAMNNASINSMVTHAISECMTDLERFQRMLEEIVDLSGVDRDEFFIKPAHDPQLTELHSAKQNVEEQVTHIYNCAVNHLGFQTKTMKLECNDQHGYLFRVTLKEEPALRDSHGYHIIDSVKGGIRFTNDKLDDLNIEYKNIKELYVKQQQNVVDEIIEVASGYSDILKLLNIAIATIDVLVSFAIAAIKGSAPFARPKLLAMGSGVLRLDKARHPCLERQDPNVIPNDVLFTKDETLKIITGANMGGKSTYIRTAAVCTYLAHIGCFVPCDAAEIPIVDAIWTRIGAGDCEAKGLSTLMMEMIDTSAFTRGATSNSLVVIDELGRGTSSFDGCGIAWAVAEYLAKEVKAFTLFATHFHEISQLAKKLSNVRNYHVGVIASDEEITPLYTIHQGPCYQSYGIPCAKMAGFPESVVNAAVEYLEELNWMSTISTLKHLDEECKQNTIDEGDEILKDIIGKFEEDCEKYKWSGETLKMESMKVQEKLRKQDNLFVQGFLNIDE